MRRWILIFVGLAVGACGQLGRLSAVADKDTGRASVLGIAEARFMPTDIVAMSAFSQRLYEREAKDNAARGRPTAREVHLLALSGGGDNGAFGAGLLVGWSENGTRPVFKIVTGISTGALIAPFAFLGSEFDPVVSRMYADIEQKDIFQRRPILAGLTSDALADSAPLQGMIAKYLDADIVERLAPDDREAVFETLDQEVAAEALEEVQPKVQKSIVESLDFERAAEIVEEMDPDAAADLLADLPEERTTEILKEMEPEERQEMTQLLEFGENTAAGRMNTEYLALSPDATVNDAIEALRNFQGGVETVSTVYLVDEREKLAGAVPLAKLILAKSDDKLRPLSMEPLISCHAGAREREVAALFDKYNLLTLPVVDDDGILTGVITSDDVISLLRAKL